MWLICFCFQSTVLIVVGVLLSKHRSFYRQNKGIPNLIAFNLFFDFLEKKILFGLDRLVLRDDLGHGVDAYGCTKLSHKILNNDF